MTIEREFMKTDIPHFDIGDTVRLKLKIKEGDKERIQPFEGSVIARKGGMHRETFTLRKISHGVGVERIFPLHSPTIQSIEVIRKGKVRRAKLYYLRHKIGKAAKIVEKNTYSSRARKPKT